MIQRYTPALNGTAFMGMTKCIRGGDYVLYADHLEEIEEENTRFHEEIAALQAQIEELESDMTQAGQDFEKELIIRTHLEQRVRELEAAIGLVGASGKEELEKMEVLIRVAPIAETDKVGMLNAIHVLMEGGER